MLVCYLDDSGKDPQNPITTIAGYVTRDDLWQRFEADVEPRFKEFNVNVLHAMDMHKTNGEFRGWSVLKKQAFISRICQARNPYVAMGLSMSASKAIYTEKAANSKKLKVTPYTFCFNVIIDRILRDVSVGLGKIAHEEGLALMVEAGHENNPEAEIQFKAIREQHNLGGVLHSLSFVSKKECRAIQLADVLAFYSRRDGVKLMKARKESKEEYQMEPMSRILSQGVTHWSFVALDFENYDDPSPFFDFRHFQERF